MTTVKKENSRADIRSLTDDAQATIKELKEKLLDISELDVVTIKSNFVIDPHAVGTQKDIVEIVKGLGERITVLAQTHQQIDGDRVNAIPTQDIGTLTCKEIWEFHSQTVEDAIQRRSEILKLIVGLINIILDSNLFVRDQ